MTYTMGMDAGGTKTECALALDGAVVARARGGTIKLLRVSEVDAAANLNRILDTIVAQTGVDLGLVRCICVGLAGNVVPRVADWVRSALGTRVGGKILLSGDEETALDAAFCGGPGVVVVAGTGSNVAARTKTGKMIRVGGWGAALSDEGSGYWIGRMAARAILDAANRGVANWNSANRGDKVSGEVAQLMEAVERHWGMTSLDTSGLAGLVERANRLPEPDYSGLAPLVAECAAAGNREALRVLERAGAELARIAGLAIARMQAAETTSAEMPEVAYTGSVLRNIAPVREAMFAALRQAFPGVRLREDAVDPVEGALWRASVEVSAVRG